RTSRAARPTRSPYTTLFRSKGIAQDAIVMNIDDLLCVGATGNILLSSTIGRNKNKVPGEVIAAIINGTEEILEMLRRYGLNIIRSEEHTSELQSRENLVCRL